MRVSTVFAALAFIPLPLKATDISGQVFIVTRGAETIKLALVPIAAYKREDVLATVKAVDVEFTKTREKTANFVQVVHEAYKEVDTARERFSSEAKYQEANKFSALASDLMRLEFSARRRSSFLNGSGIYFEQLERDHRVVTTAKTDAEGKFTMKIPDDGEFALVASAHREVPDNIELYFWIVPAKQHTDLTNENLTSATGDSLLHVTGKDESSDPSVPEATLQADLNKIKTAYADVFAAIANPPATSKSVPTVMPLPSTVTLTRSISVKIPYGTVTLQPGAKLPLISRDGATVRVRYMDSEQIIPISATDFK